MQILRQRKAMLEEELLGWETLTNKYTEKASRLVIFNYFYFL